MSLRNAPLLGRFAFWHLIRVLTLMQSIDGHPQIKTVGILQQVDSAHCIVFFHHEHARC